MPLSVLSSDHFLQYLSFVFSFALNKTFKKEHTEKKKILAICDKAKSGQNVKDQKEN